MALKKCKECGKEVSSEAKSCPHCGYENKDLATKMEEAGSTMQSVGCALTLLVTIPIILFLMGGC